MLDLKGHSLLDRARSFQASLASGAESGDSVHPPTYTRIRLPSLCLWQFTGSDSYNPANQGNSQAPPRILHRYSCESRLSRVVREQARRSAQWR